MQRASSWIAALLASACLFWCVPSQAQASGPAYPTKAIRIVVGYPPGGTTDVLARQLAAELTRRLGQTVYVENKPGASGMLGTDVVAKAPADGYTLLFSASTLATYRSLYARVPFDPVKDLAPVALVASTPYVFVVHPSLPVKTLPELIRYAREHPGKINYAASVPGSGQHLAAELLKQQTKAEMLYVPYKGSAAALPDLFSGRLQMAIDNVAVVGPYIRSGQVHGLAVTGRNPSSSLPEVPPVAKDLPNFDVVGWFALFAPAGTPEPVIQALAAATRDAGARKEIREKMLSLGAEPAGSGPAELRQLLASEIAKWSAVIKEAGITMQ